LPATLTPALALTLGFIAFQAAMALSPLILALLPRRDACRGPKRGPDEVEFVVVTKALRGVLPTLREVLERLRDGFPGYKVWVVTDDDSPGLEELVSWKRILGFHLVVVPSSYRRGKFKSRAIQYFIDYYVDPRKWYVFLDDDSYPLDDKFLCQLDPSVPVYNGIIYPRRGRSLLAWLADGSRFFHSISRQRFALGILHKPVYGLHGELLIVRGDVLRRVPMASDSIVEDTLYAARLIRAGIPAGMVSTRVSILSPNSIRDFWRQRARWQLGILRDIVRGLYPPSLALTRAADILVWLLAPASPLLWAYIGLHLSGGGHLMRALGILALLLYFTIAVNHGQVAARELGPLRGLALSLTGLYPLMIIYYASPVYAILRAPSILSRFVIIDKSSHLTQRGGRGEPEAPPPQPAMAPLAAGGEAAVLVGGAGGVESLGPPVRVIAEVHARRMLGSA
jgi:egghead protein (zeste-white 4 protein)